MQLMCLPTHGAGCSTHPCDAWPKTPYPDIDPAFFNAPSVPCGQLMPVFLCVRCAGAMNVNLRLAHDKLLQHRVTAPCTGEVAKALGKVKLEEMLPGLLVKFVSYQEAEGKPEKALSNDEPVLRGAILNFTVDMGTVLQRLQRHDTLLKDLYRERVLSLMAKYSSRFLKPPNEGSEAKQGVVNFFQSDPQKAAAAEAALVAVGSGLSSNDFAMALDDMYYERGSEWPPCSVQDARPTPLLVAHPQCTARNFTYCGCIACAEIQHINTTVQLEAEMKQLCKNGCVDMLEDDMPIACTIIKHYDIFLALLP